MVYMSGVRVDTEGSASQVGCQSSQESSKAYRVYDIEAGKVVISRDVNFDETVPGGSHFDSVRVSDTVSSTGWTKSRTKAVYTWRTSSMVASASLVHRSPRTHVHSLPPMKTVMSNAPVAQLVSVLLRWSGGVQVPTWSRLRTCASRRRTRRLSLVRTNFIGKLPLLQNFDPWTTVKSSFSQNCQLVNVPSIPSGCSSSVSMASVCFFSCTSTMCW